MGDVTYGSIERPKAWSFPTLAGILEDEDSPEARVLDAIDALALASDSSQKSKVILTSDSPSSTARRVTKHERASAVMRRGKPTPLSLAPDSRSTDLTLRSGCRVSVVLLT